MQAENTERPAGRELPAEWRQATTQSATELVAEVAENPWGTMSPSVYETARLVRTAPWLDGHAARCDFLLRTQRTDGWWGHPDGYDLVPTLSTTEALLHEIDRPATEASRPAVAPLARAAMKGLWALADRLGRGHESTVPDTIAAELIIPWLVDELNSRLAGSGGRLGATELSLPPGVERQSLARLRAVADAGRPLPEKVWHTLEVLGSRAADAPGVSLAAAAIGSSPAATAAWLVGRPPREEALALLTATQARWGGPVPGVVSIAVFERAWVLGWLLDAGLPVPVPPTLTAYLQDSLGASGASAGPGLPADSDDTAAVIHALALADQPASVESLWHYESDGYFLCFPGERTPSTSTNAHILQALTATAPAAESASQRARRQAAVGTIERWLFSLQHQDGSWDDKWHASPYYATMCCAHALAHSRRAGAARALARAAQWILDTQRPDGSWGRWQGTAEETSYAVQTLLRSHQDDLPPHVARAVFDGCAHLLAYLDDEDFPPLWHDKDLYVPVAVVKAARIAALHIAATRLTPAGQPAVCAVVQ